MPRIQITLINALKLMGVAAILLWLNVGLYPEHNQYGWPITVGAIASNENSGQIQAHGEFIFYVVDVIFNLFILWVFFMNLRRNQQVQKPWNRSVKLFLGVFAVLVYISFWSDYHHHGPTPDLIIYKLVSAIVLVATMLRVRNI